MQMRVEISALSIQMTETDSGTKRDVGRNILHRFVVQCRLELRRHETVSLSRVYQAQEMDGKHSTVKSNWNDDEAEEASEEMLEPQTLQNCLISFGDGQNGRIMTHTGVTVLVSPRRTHS